MGVDLQKLRAPEPKRIVNVTVVVTEASFASTSIGPIEVFHSAGTLWNYFQGEAGEPRFRVQVASVDGGHVETLCALGLMPNLSIEDVEDVDIIVLPASGLDVQDRIARTSSLLPWLRRWHERGALIAGICTGVAFLAESGLLDGRRATTHWAVADILRARYPKVLWHPELFITEDGPLFCSGGVYSSIDLSLFLVERFCGHEIAVKCAKSLLLSMPRNSQAGYAMLPLSMPHSDARIRKSEEYLQAHLGEPIDFDAVAERIGMSGRSFVRRFRSATGHSPGEYLQSLRIRFAKGLLETERRPIASVAASVGYSDVTYFRQLFKRHTGITPTEYRERFGLHPYAAGELEAGRREANLIGTVVDPSAPRRS